MNTVDEIQERLEQAGLRLKERRSLNDRGEQLRFDSGEIVNVFHNGTIQPQGKNIGCRAVRCALARSWGAREPPPASKIFVRHKVREIVPTRGN